MNGLIVTRLEVNSFIATLGTTGIGAGIAFIITNGADLAYQPTWLQDNLGAKVVADVPLPVLIVGVFVLVLWAVMRFTRFGLHTAGDRIVGDERRARRPAGGTARPSPSTCWPAPCAGLPRCST